MTAPGQARGLLLAIPAPWDGVYRAAIADALSDRPVVTPEEVEDPFDIGFALALFPERGLLAHFPRLRLIMPIGAGVEHLLADPGLPPGVPILRAVQPDMIRRMSEYVVQHVLNHHRQARCLRVQQASRTWSIVPQPAAADRVVGILGMGVLGSDAAAKLGTIGFRVRGWSRTAKTLAGVESFHGADTLPRFLAETEILVCLLPQTPMTRHLVDRQFLAWMPAGASIINAGRGGVIDDEALLEALDCGHICEATLDTFTTEPLPLDHPYWAHPSVTVTPHCASAVTPGAIARRLREAIDAIEAGKTPVPLVDRAAGY